MRNQRKMRVVREGVIELQSGGTYHMLDPETGPIERMIAKLHLLKLHIEAMSNDLCENGENHVHCAEDVELIAEQLYKLYEPFINKGVDVFSKRDFMYPNALLRHIAALNVEPYKLSWTSWNTGGGCYVYDHDFCDGRSIHVSSDCVILSTLNSEKHWEAENDDEGEFKHHIAVINNRKEDLAFYLVPYLGQEMADLVVEDIDKINMKEDWI